MKTSVPSEPVRNVMKYLSSRMAMMGAPSAARFIRFIEIFGMEILQYYQQKQIATYLGLPGNICVRCMRGLWRL